MLKKIRSLVSNSSFIEIYDDVIPVYECERLISLFEKSDNKIEGHCGSPDGTAIRPEVKKTIELSQCGFSKGDSISNIIKNYLVPCVTKYTHKYSDIKYISKIGLDDVYTFQKLEHHDDGFKRWHADSGSFIDSPRVLVWMFYLNDAKSGTDFMYYPTVKGKTGRCIIWPAGFTHIHRASPNKGLKYVVTGWISYTD